jgi:hypothetical protein
VSAVLKQGPRPYSREFQPMPEVVPALELVPLDPAKQGFSGRLPPVTEEERLAVDRARDAKKATPEWKDLEVNFALEQQNGRRS